MGVDTRGAAVDVLLATRNGARYLRAQLDSILAQANVDVRVTARDDLSTDGTSVILEEYASRLPGRVRLLRDEGHLGAAGSFSALLEQSDRPYIAFADQDDVWRPQKLRRLVDAIQDIEASVQPGTPVLAHCDLEVVDESLEPVAVSFLGHSGIDPRRNSLANLLICNTVTGCGALLNNALARLAAPIPREALMHDYWAALVAAATGRIVFVDERLVQYRQHDTNTLGATRFRTRDSLSRLFRFAISPALRTDRSAHMKAHFDRLRGQAVALQARVKDIPAIDTTLLDGFCGLSKSSWPSRCAFVVRNDLLYPQRIRNLGLLFDI